MGMLQRGQGLFQVATPDVAPIDHAQGQHFISRQAIKDGRVLVGCTHQVDVQAINRQVGGKTEVFFQPTKVGSHQLFQGVALDQVVGALKRVFPFLRQVEHQDGLVDLYPLHTQVSQALEDLPVQRQQAFQQVKLVEVATLGLAQPQVGQWTNDDGLDVMPQVAGFLHFLEQLVPPQVEVLVSAEFGHQVVVVGIEPLGHFLCVGTTAAAVADAARHAEQRVQGGVAIGWTETLRNHAEHQRVGKHLVVPGKITGRQQFDTRVLLQRPVGLAQFTANGTQTGFVELAFPERFLRFFQFAIASNARKSEGMSDCHDLQLQCR
ncbi:hypothetical protein PS663_05719 [Pseudomonas fluorescens]|nr:hypothetical protein PS663_05719 [Pseudomonas fluorescens]